MTHKHGCGHYLGPTALAAALAVLALVVVMAPRDRWLVGVFSHRSITGSHPTTAARVAPRKLPPYWIVKPGDTYAQISLTTGLSIDQLQAFNPQVDPSSLTVGERLNLWARPPRPRPKPLGPRFWTVRPGQSFGYIAAKTGISLDTLERLNPRLKPATLQPGDRVALRP